MIALLPGVACATALACRLIIVCFVSGGESRSPKATLATEICSHDEVQAALLLGNDVLLGSFGVAINLFQRCYPFERFENAIHVQRFHSELDRHLANLDGRDVFENQLADFGSNEH